MKRLLIMVVAAVAVVACSPFVLKSSGALNDSNLADYKSFEMQKIDKDQLPKSVQETDLIRLYRALADQLIKRGYTQVESGGDLTVHIGLSKKQSLETNVNTSGYIGVGGPVGPAGHGGPAWGGYNYYGATPYVHGYYGSSSATTELVTDGVLIMDLVDNSNNNHVFYAQISANVDGEKLILRDNEKLAKAAAKLFKKFPVEIIKK